MAKERERVAWIKVIDLYKDMTYMYDKKNREYFNRAMRQDAYNMLLQVYNDEIDEATNLTTFKKKLENMKTTYARELKKLNASRQMGADGIYVPSLWYFRLFEFLEDMTESCRTGPDPMDEPRHSESSDTSGEPARKRGRDEEYPAASATPPPPPQFINPTSPRKLRSSLQKKQEKVFDTALMLLNKKEEDWEVIGKSIGLQMKDLSRDQKNIAQKLISDAIFYGRLNKLTEESHITLSPYPLIEQQFPPYTSFANQQRSTVCSPNSVHSQPSPKYEVPIHTPPPNHIDPLAAEGSGVNMKY